MSRKKVTFTRTIDVGPCAVTVNATGNPLAWTAEDRRKVEQVLNALDTLDMLNHGPKDATPATSQP